VDRQGGGHKAALTVWLSKQLTCLKSMALTWGSQPAWRDTIRGRGGWRDPHRVGGGKRVMDVGTSAHWQCGCKQLARPTNGTCAQSRTEGCCSPVWAQVLKASP
jgi:hypothetical protein